MKEKIKFNFNFTSEFWDLPPMVDILINQQIMWTGAIAEKKQAVVFFSELDLNKNYILEIRRYNKDDTQCKISDDGVVKDQYLIVDDVIIDDINIQNLIWHNSWFEPVYPETWALEQTKKGIELEKKVPGETWLSHNGTWYFKFTSPFYKFVINQFG
jgi:hypothetical protein